MASMSDVEAKEAFDEARTMADTLLAELEAKEAKSKVVRFKRFFGRLLNGKV